MYNKQHLQEICDLLWEDKLAEFSKEYYDFVDIYQWDDKHSVAMFLNLALIKGWRGHVFYTLAHLKYDSL